MGRVGAEKAAVHGKRRWWMFGPKGKSSGGILFNVLACLKEDEGVRLQKWGSVNLPRHGVGGSARR